MPPVTPVPIALSGTIHNNLGVSSLGTLQNPASDGDLEVTLNANYIATVGEPFEGLTFQAGDKFVYISDPAFAGKGTTAEGYQFDSGWIYAGQAPVNDPFTATPPPQQAGPWQLVPIDGGLKVAQTDATLPLSAPAGEVWIVLSSGRAAGQQALYAYDPGVGIWQPLSGGASPIDLTGGSIIYPKSLFYPGEPPADLTQTVPQPQIVGDTLWCHQRCGASSQRSQCRETARTWTQNQPAAA